MFYVLYPVTRVYLLLLILVIIPGYPRASVASDTCYVLLVFPCDIVILHLNVCCVSFIWSLPSPHYHMFLYLQFCVNYMWTSEQTFAAFQRIFSGDNSFDFYSGGDRFRSQPKYQMF
jgi:hypothetical protein